MRLQRYRVKDESKLFKESPFNIILMSDKGEFISARYGSRFNFSLLNQKITLKPGKYVFMIDPIWNDTANNHPNYKDVLVDIYGPESVDLQPLTDEVGMQYLVRALKKAAMTVSPEETRQTYLEDNEDYGTDVIRVSDVESLDCWYGYIYTLNKSPFELTETLRPQLDGLEVVYPAIKPDEEDIELEIPAGQDHIIILRRTENSCKYGLQYLTHQRKLSDDEMIEATKNLEELTPFGESNSYYKLFNTAQGAVFFFENCEDDKTLHATFELQMENLFIQGEKQGVTSFDIVLK